MAPSVQTFELVNWKTLTDSNLAVLINACPNLTRLNLAGSIALSDETLKLIQTTIAPNLVSLSLARCPLISDEAVVGLLRIAPHLKQLVLDNCTDLTSITVKAVADNCKEVIELGLNGLTRINNDEFVLSISHGLISPRLRINLLLSIQYLLYRCTAMRRLELQSVKTIGAHFIHRILRHECPNVSIILNLSLMLPIFQL